MLSSCILGAALAGLAVATPQRWVKSEMWARNASDSPCAIVSSSAAAALAVAPSGMLDGSPNNMHRIWNWRLGVDVAG